MSLVTRSGDVGDRRKTGEMNMKCAAETFSGAVGVCLTQGRRTEGDRAWAAGRRGHAVENACP